MKITYTVHSVTVQPITVKIMVGARAVNALFDGVEVELVNAQNGHTFRFVPEDDAALKEALALFRVGQDVSVSFASAAPDEAIQGGEQR